LRRYHQGKPSQILALGLAGLAVSADGATVYGLADADNDTCQRFLLPQCRRDLIVRAADDGSEPALLSLDPAASCDQRPQALATHPLDADRLFVLSACNDLYESRDRGQTFTPLGSLASAADQGTGVGFVATAGSVFVSRHDGTLARWDLTAGAAMPIAAPASYWQLQRLTANKLLLSDEDGKEGVFVIDDP
jgi:hypothetical protein